MKKILGIFIISVVSLGAYSQDEMEMESGEKHFVLKYCPTQLVAGEFNFSYEQRLARMVSLELEIGPTISQFGLNFGNQQLWQGDIWGFDAVDDNANAAIGFHASLAPRFYPMAQENDMRGLYISPVFKYRRYNYTNEDMNGMLDDARSNIDQLILRFNMGFQFWPGNGHFSLDMFFGVGLSTYNIKGQNVNSFVNDQGMVESSWSSYSDTGIRFNAATGVRFGFGM